MFNGWFRKFEVKVPSQAVAPLSQNAVQPPHDPASSAHDATDRCDRGTSHPPTFEQIYNAATVKPRKTAYGIQKVAEMANSKHLMGMSPEFKRKALLMALTAAGTDEGEVLNDLVIRQRALKEYEDRFWTG